MKKLFVLFIPLFLLGCSYHQPLYRSQGFENVPPPKVIVKEHNVYKDRFNKNRKKSRVGGW